jgi:signal transduction histidine kinase/CheY-like chemotaxis protein
LPLLLRAALDLSVTHMDRGRKEPMLQAMSEPQDQSHEWRAGLLTGSLRVFALVALVLTGAALLAPVQVAWFSALLGSCAVATLAAASGEGLGYRVRALFLLAAVHGVCATLLLHGGILTPNTSAAFLLEAVLATLLFGRRAGLLSVLVVGLTFLAASILLQGGATSRPLDWYRSFDTAMPMVAVRVGLVACGVGVAAVFGISHLLLRLEHAIAQRDAAQVKLEEVHAERVRVLTELEQREAEFLRARELEVLGRLAGFVAHDFNNALLAIFGGVELMRRARSDQDQRDALGIVQAAATQAASTAKQLRAFGPQPKREGKPVDPVLVIRTAERMLRTLLPKNIALSVQAEPTPRICVDEGLLQGALMNLALNAWDAMRDGGKLEIQVRSAGDRILIEVRDSGSGMDEATVARLFAPFFTTKGAQGSGLGLSSVRQTVEAAGGAIEVQSTPDQGTCVQLFWPALADESRISVPAVIDGGAVLGGNVLVLDDDHAVRSAVATYLRRCGITTFEATTQDEARQLTAASHVDVVVTDGVIAGVPAAGLLRELRASTPALRVMLCSGVETEGFEAMRSLADATLPKPFELDTLVNRLRPLMTMTARESRAGRSRHTACAV